MRWTRGEFAVVDDQSLIDVDAVHDFLKGSYWAKGRSRMVVQLAMERSLAFGLIHDDRTIGFTRVITDFAVVGVIEDVYVLPFPSRPGRTVALHRFPQGPGLL